MTDTTNASLAPRCGLGGFDAYRIALSFYRELRVATRGRRGHVVDQVHRAAESVVLNVAEAHPTTGADRARGLPRAEAVAPRRRSLTLRSPRRRRPRIARRTVASFHRLRRPADGGNEVRCGPMPTPRSPTHWCYVPVS